MRQVGSDTHGCCITNYPELKNSQGPGSSSAGGSGSVRSEAVIGLLPGLLCLRRLDGGWRGSCRDGTSHSCRREGMAP